MDARLEALERENAELRATLSEAPVGRLSSRIAGYAAFELSNLLTIVMASAHLLEDDDLTREDVRELCEGQVEVAVRCNEHLRTLLALARRRTAEPLQVGRLSEAFDEVCGPAAYALGAPRTCEAGPDDLVLAEGVPVRRVLLHALTEVVGISSDRPCDVKVKTGRSLERPRVYIDYRWPTQGRRVPTYALDELEGLAAAAGAQLEFHRAADAAHLRLHWPAAHPIERPTVDAPKHVVVLADSKPVARWIQRVYFQAGHECSITEDLEGLRSLLGTSLEDEVVVLDVPPDQGRAAVALVRDIAPRAALVRLGPLLGDDEPADAYAAILPRPCTAEDLHLALAEVGSPRGASGGR